MSLSLFIIGVILLVALIVIMTFAVAYQKRSFECYHQVSPQCHLDWMCPTPTCDRKKLADGNSCGKFRVCTKEEITSGKCPFPAQTLSTLAALTSKCKSPTDKVIGPDGSNICKTAWQFLPTDVNLAIPR